MLWKYPISSGYVQHVSRLVSRTGNPGLLVERCDQDCGEYGKVLRINAGIARQVARLAGPFWNRSKAQLKQREIFQIDVAIRIEIAIAIRQALIIRLATPGAFPAGRTHRLASTIRIACPGSRAEKPVLTFDIDRAFTRITRSTAIDPLFALIENAIHARCRVVARVRLDANRIDRAPPTISTDAVRCAHHILRCSSGFSREQN